MRRLTSAVFTAVVVACAVAAPAMARTHQATVGNYYYEHDEQRDRTKIVVAVGDQITFTVRQAAYPPHTVDVDELDVHSPDLLVGQTYTTPPLDRAGNFRLYCRPHEQRGHHTRLVVQAAAATATPAPPAKTAVPTARPRATSAPPVSGGRTPPPSVKPSATPTLAPIGVGTAAPGALDRPLPVDPDSLQGLTGVTRSNRYPWTRAVWWLLLATVPIVGAAGFALRREAVLRAAEARAKPTAAKPTAKRRPRKAR